MSLGNALGNAGQPEEAIHIFQDAVEQFKREGWVWKRLCEELLVTHDVEAAIKHYQEGIRWVPNDVLLPILLGDAYQIDSRSLDHGKSVTAYQLAVEKAPAVLSAYLNLPPELNRSSDLRGANIKVDERMFKNFRWFSLVKGYQEISNSQEISKVCQDVIERYRAATKRHENRLLWHYIVDLNPAVVKKPNGFWVRRTLPKAVIWSALGAALSFLGGRVDAAIQAFHEAHNIEPENKWLISVLKQLQGKHGQLVAGGVPEDNRFEELVSSEPNSADDSRFEELDSSEPNSDGEAEINSESMDPATYSDSDSILAAPEDGDQKIMYPERVHPDAANSYSDSVATDSDSDEMEEQR
jgi:tetratricopeptide (TPR) repeat protein